MPVSKIYRLTSLSPRAKQLDAYHNDPTKTPSQKKQEAANIWRSEISYLRLLRSKDTPRNYNTIKVIGKGAFGEVKLVQKRQDGKIYALKCLVKSEMFKKEQLAHVRAERDILAQSDSPWVVKLFTTFQDPVFLYMLMEFLPGGDLMTMLIKYEIFTEDVTRFYMAEILLAIEAVHKLGYIHRYVGFCLGLGVLVIWCRDVDFSDSCVHASSCHITFSTPMGAHFVISLSSIARLGKHSSIFPLPLQCPVMCLPIFQAYMSLWFSASVNLSGLFASACLRSNCVYICRQIWCTPSFNPLHQMS